MGLLPRMVVRPMFSVFFDATTKNWTVKYKDDKGKERRKRLQKGVHSAEIPPEIMKLADQYRPTKAALTIATTSNGMPLAAYCDRYFEIRSQDLRANTLETLRHVLVEFKRVMGKSNIHTVEQISVAVLQDWLTARLKTITKSTGKNQLALLSGLLNMAVDENILVSNPAHARILKSRLKEKGAKPTHYYTCDQTARLISALNQAVEDKFIQPKYRDAALIMLGTGARVNAAIRIEAEWIQGDKINIPKIHDKAGTGYVAIILPPAKEVIDRLMTKHKTGRLIPVITSQRVWVHLKRLAKNPKYNLQDIVKMGRFSHNLRHTFATTLVNRGVPMEVIMKVMGHHQIATTQRYAKVDQSTVEKFLSGVSIA